MLEQQYSTPMFPKCAIAHGSSTGGTTMFNHHKKVPKTHFNIILPFPSKLCFSETFLCSTLSASPLSAACCTIQLWGQVQQFGSCKCCGLPVSEDVWRVGVKYC